MNNPWWGQLQLSDMDGSKYQYIIEGLHMYKQTMWRSEGKGRYHVQINV